MRRFQRLRSRRALPGWILSPFKFVIWLIERGGDTDFIASLFGKRFWDVIAFLNEWGWLATIAGILWLVYLLLKPEDPDAAAVSGSIVDSPSASLRTDRSVKTANASDEGVAVNAVAGDVHIHRDRPSRAHPPRQEPVRLGQIEHANARWTIWKTPSGTIYVNGPFCPNHDEWGFELLYLDSPEANAGDVGDDAYIHPFDPREGPFAYLWCPECGENNHLDATEQRKPRWVRSVRKEALVRFKGRADC